MSEEIDRRTFLRFGVGIVGALALETALYPMKQKANQLVVEHTDFKAGNAGLREDLERECGGSLDPVKCAADLMDEDKPYAIFWGPVIEESLFRSLPSTILGAVKSRIDLYDDEEESFAKHLATMTKSEGIVGAVTAAVFAAVHNITRRGFDTRTIPMSQFMAGLEYWYLQRKFGFLSNFLAHSYHNSRIYLFKK